jgi:hypothetical protein
MGIALTTSTMLMPMPTLAGTGEIAIESSIIASILSSQT